MRYLKLSTLLMLPVAFALTMGAVPQTAEAGKLCKKAGLKKNCGVSSDVRNLQAKDLRDEPGAAFSGGNQHIHLATNTTVRSVTIVAPKPGMVIVHASGDVQFESSSQRAACSITTGTTVDFSFAFQADNDETAGVLMMPFGSTRAFVVPAGSLTVNLVCTETVGSFIAINDSMLTALYVPTQY